MTSSKSTSGRSNGRSNGSSHQVLPKQLAIDAQQMKQGQDPKLIIRTRIAVAFVLFTLSFALVPFVEPRIVDPFHNILVLDPLFGLFLYWPLSRVLIRASTLLWGHILALIPSFILIGMRFYGAERDPVFGTQPNLPFGTMIFLGVCSIAAYLLFRNPPKKFD